ncbi:MAG: hypothetical protein LR015_07045 [Verrucomicrobia bacterium]|nr:hypothetical protein [Verrucomicrobiota bacterium]
MKYFGTDGIRDRVDGPLLAHAFVRRLGRAAGTFFAQTSAGETTVVIGRDTRDSGEQLMQALCAGLRSIGVKVLDAGMVPTPAVACVVPHPARSLLA